MTRWQKRPISGRSIAVCASIALLGAVAATLNGCQSSWPGSNSFRGAREVGLAEFARSEMTPDDSQYAEDSEHNNATAEPRTTETNMLVRLQASSSPTDEPHPNWAIADDPEPRFQPRRVIVDSLIGQVNGRPIFANDFFAPIEDQLRAIGQRTSQREFVEQSRAIIIEHLRQIVLNELFLAEAESQLTEDQQMGVLAWMQNLRDVTIAEGGGTRTGTDQQLQQREGMTIDQYVEARRDMALLHQLRRDKIEPRVIVSWRDVQREYERHWDDFNPPAILKLARIRLATNSQTDLIQQVNQRLAAGEPFAEIAASIGQEKDGQLWQQFQMGANGIQDIALAEHIRQHIVSLEVGQTCQPFEQGSSTWWLHIADIEQPEGHSLYKVQRALRTRLQERRFNQEMSRYIDSLFEKGIYDELDSMLLRLIEIAMVRYWQ